METIKGKKKISYRDSFIYDNQRIMSPCFNRKTDVKDWVSKTRQELKMAKLMGVRAHSFENVTFEDFSKRWLEESMKTKLSPSTYRNYERYLRLKINPLFGKKLMKDVRIEDADRLSKKLKAEGHNSKGANLILACLKSIMNEAEQREYIGKNPLRHFKLLSPDPQQYKYWDKPMAQQFLAASLNDPLYPVYLTAIYTGMRRGELAGLCWDRVNFSENLIYVSRIRDIDGLRETTKTKLIRQIPIHPEVKRVLEGLLRNQKNPQFVFCRPDGGPIEVKHIYRTFRNAQKKAGITNPIKFHDLRHTAASTFIMNGASIFEVQKILGHTDVKMTMRYSHHSSEYLQQMTRFMGVGDVVVESYTKSTQNLEGRENLLLISNS